MLARNCGALQEKAGRRQREGSNLLALAAAMTEKSGGALHIHLMLASFGPARRDNAAGPGRVVCER